MVSLENLGRKIVLFPSLFISFFLFLYFFLWRMFSLPSLFLNYFLLYFIVLSLNRKILTWFSEEILLHHDLRFTTRNSV